LLTAFKGPLLTEVYQSVTAVCFQAAPTSTCGLSLTFRWATSPAGSPVLDSEHEVEVLADVGPLQENVDLALRLSSSLQYLLDLR
jgi:hypothetical protein